MSNDVIDSYAESVSLERKAAGAYTSGAFVPGATTTSTIVAVTEAEPGAVALIDGTGTNLVGLPLDATQVTLLDAGREVEAAVAVYTETLLTTDVESTRVSADVIVWDSRRWVVHKVERRTQISGLEHYKAIALLEDVG